MGKANVKNESFDDYLSGFSKQEQEQAFGPAVLRAYRRGELSPAQMKRQKSSMKLLESFSAMEPRSLPQSTEDIIDKAAKASADEANEITRLRRAQRIAEGLAAQGRDGAENQSASQSTWACNDSLSEKYRRMGAEEGRAAGERMRLADQNRTRQNLGLPPLGSSEAPGT